MPHILWGAIPVVGYFIGAAVEGEWGDGSRQELGAVDRAEPERESIIWSGGQSSESASSHGSDQYEGIKLIGAAENREQIKKALDFYAEDKELFGEFKRNVRSINCDHDRYAGLSHGNGHIELNPGPSVMSIAGTAAHECEHERGGWGSTEETAEAYEQEFWERRRNIKAKVKVKAKPAQPTSHDHSRASRSAARQQSNNRAKARARR